jgi:hypothetical protein
MRFPLSLVSFALLAGCVSAPEPAPPPPPAPMPVPTAAAPAPPPFRGDWRDWKASPGDWAYRRDARGSIALFGPPGGDAEFTIRCDRQAGQLYLSRRGAAPGNLPMTIRTSSMSRSLDARPTGGTPAYMAVAIGARDSLLDAIGYSRGRFVVEMAPLPVLVLPSWAEALRVVEDCRD